MRSPRGCYDLLQCRLFIGHNGVMMVCELAEGFQGLRLQMTFWTYGRSEKLLDTCILT